MRTTVEKAISNRFDFLNDLFESTNGNDFTHIDTDKLHRRHAVSNYAVITAISCDYVKRHPVHKGLYQWSRPGVRPTTADAKKLHTEERKIRQRDRGYVSRKVYQPQIVNAEYHINALKNLGYTGELHPPSQTIKL